MTRTFTGYVLTNAQTGFTGKFHFVSSVVKVMIFKMSFSCSSLCGNFKKFRG